MPRISGRLHAFSPNYVNQREYLFCYTRFRHGISCVQGNLIRTVHAFWRKSAFWRESSMVIRHSKIRIMQKQRIAFTLNSHFQSKSVNCLYNSRYMRLCEQTIDNIIRTSLFVAFDLDLYQIENGKDFTATLRSPFHIPYFSSSESEATDSIVAIGYS